MKIVRLSLWKTLCISLKAGPGNRRIFKRLPDFFRSRTFPIRLLLLNGYDDFRFQIEQLHQKWEIAFF